LTSEQTQPSSRCPPGAGGIEVSVGLLAKGRGGSMQAGCIFVFVPGGVTLHASVIGHGSPDAFLMHKSNSVRGMLSLSGYHVLPTLPATVTDL
jgi:hypothetical protein